MYNFIDLFAGLSGIRIGFENAARDLGVETHCVLTSEIKPAALEALKHRYPNEQKFYDIYDVSAADLPEGSDIILGGFPCQAFSAAGKGLGFLDTRGTLFFEIERIISELSSRGQKPKGFILENVEGLVSHGGKGKGDKYGKTLSTILSKLKLAGYSVSVKVLDASKFGVAQRRKRVYIVGVDSKYGNVNLEDLPQSAAFVKDILDYGQPTDTSKFTQCLIKNIGLNNIAGKCIKDKRGGSGNIHSWDLEIKGKVSPIQKKFLNLLLKERRKKKWAAVIGIDWMDGMPLTKEQIETFFQADNLQEMLDDLVSKGYLAFEHPKKLVHLTDGTNFGTRREPDASLPKGYNIVTGKLSFEYSQILDPDGVAPTMVAMDMERVGVIDGNGIRRLTIAEGLRLFGYNNYDLSYLEGQKNGRKKAFDLLGNSVCVPVIKALATRLITTIENSDI
jgi:DNA (cytosine-5)-methyltransferase 1